MGDLTKQILNEYARRQKPAWREAYLKDVMVHTQVNSTRYTLEAVERAMRAEGLPEETILRVLHKAAFGDSWVKPGEEA